MINRVRGYQRKSGPDDKPANPKAYRTLDAGKGELKSAKPPVPAEDGVPGEAEGLEGIGFAEIADEVEKKDT